MILLNITDMQLFLVAAVLRTSTRTERFLLSVALRYMNQQIKQHTLQNNITRSNIMQ